MHDLDRRKRRVAGRIRRSPLLSLKLGLDVLQILLEHRFHPTAQEWRGQLERAVRLELHAHHQMRARRGRHDTTAADGLKGT